MIPGWFRMRQFLRREDTMHGIKEQECDISSFPRDRMHRCVALSLFSLAREG